MEGRFLFRDSEICGLLVDSRKNKGQFVSILKRLLPPFMLDLLLFLIRPVTGFTGKYSDWNDARLKCLGYEDIRIIDWYREGVATRSVAHKLAPVRRLGQRQARVLAAFGVVASIRGTPITKVVDFGGAGGGYFFDLRAMLPRLESWVVVESDSVVRALSNVNNVPVELTFERSIPSQENQVILAIGAIPCVERGLKMLDEFAAKSDFLILDRTPVMPQDRSWVSIQRTSRLFGETGTSYPSWFFSQEDFENQIQGKWSVIMEWQVPEDAPWMSGRREPYRGYLLQKL